MQKSAIIKKAILIDRILTKSYGHNSTAITPPTDELILTVLSQNTNDVNRDRAFIALKKRFPTWADVCAAKPSDIVRAIQVGGLSAIKSKRIKKILSQIGEKSSDYSLSFLKNMSDADKKLLNCYTDLNRAAVSLKLAPRSSCYKMFVDHALKILRSMKEDTRKRFDLPVQAGIEIERTVGSKLDSERKADKLLTIGLLLKP